MTRLSPRATIGILGGGQLGRMTALAASELGLRTLIYQPERDGPGFDVATETLSGAYDNESKLAEFAARCDVITYEFENVPAATVSFLDRLKPVRPGARMLSVSQDRLSEKTFLAEIGIGRSGASARSRSWKWPSWRWAAPACSRPGASAMTARARC